MPTLVTGVGKVRAATATTWAVLLHRPAVILNVGTAGSLRVGAIATEAVHDIGAVIQHDVRGRAIAELVGSDPSPAIELGDSPVVLATGDPPRSPGALGEGCQ